MIVEKWVLSPIQSLGAEEDSNCSGDLSYLRCSEATDPLTEAIPRNRKDLFDHDVGRRCESVLFCRRDRMTKKRYIRPLLAGH